MAVFNLAQDVIVNADQSASNYWMRAVPQTTCSNNNNTADIRGIVRYDSSSSDTPTSTGYDLADDCNDMPMSSLVPYVAADAGTETSSQELPVSVALNSKNLLRWSIGGTVRYDLDIL